MPRESVYPTNRQTTDEGGTPLPQPFLLQVGWHRDLHANVGITLPDDETMLSRFYGDEEQRQKIGCMLVWWLVEELPKWRERFPDLTAIPGTGNTDVQVLGSEVLRWVEGQRHPTGSNDGLWVDLDRAQANRLITLVRKARDQAYGRDA